jgi:hypothetical protein
MIEDVDKAYIAGLFDGEGSIHFKRGIEKKKKHKGEGYRYSNSMRINMEITMTDYSVLVWVHETLGVGTLRPKTVKGTRKDGTKYLPQWKWRCTFRDAYYVCLLIWPWSHVKLEKIHDVIEYYSEKKLKEGNVVHLEDWKRRAARNV